MGNIEKFDSIADQYDTPERDDIAGVVASMIREHIKNGKEKDAIDYGCGTGLVGMRLLNDFRSMLFIDASKNMVEQVKQKINRMQVKNADALCYDFETQSIFELHADYIIIAQTLLHIKEIVPVLARLYNILNESGRLLIVDFNKNEDIVSDEVHNGFEQEKLINIVKKIGFLEASARTFYNGKKMFMNKDASLFILEAVK